MFFFIKVRNSLNFYLGFQVQCHILALLTVFAILLIKVFTLHACILSLFDVSVLPYCTYN